MHAASLRVNWQMLPTNKTLNAAGWRPGINKASMKSIGILIALILTLNSSLLVRGQTQETRKRKNLVGTVVAVFGFQFFPCTCSCGASLILRLSDTHHKPIQYAQVVVIYWPDSRLPENGFPRELVVRSRKWSFQAVRVKKEDTQLKELMRFTQVSSYEDMINGKGIDVTDEVRMQNWILLPGAESEQLPFGQTLPYYKANSYKPSANRVCTAHRLYI